MSNCPRCGVPDYQHDTRNAQARGADSEPYDGYEVTFYDCELNLGGMPRTYIPAGTSPERMHAQPNRSSRRLT